DGFCPSFVSVVGGHPHKAASTGPADRQRLQALIAALPEPAFKRYDGHCNVLVVGIGGTGVMTVGAILSMASHLEGRAASVLDITGLAQKGGTVISHLRLSTDASQTGAVRIGARQADVAIMADVVAAAKPETLQTLRHDHTLTVINTHLAPTSEFTQDPQAGLDPRGLIDTLRTTAGHARLLQAHDLAAKQFGDSILANMIMLGFAWQLGGLPVSAQAIMQAIKLNGVAVQA